MKNYRQLVHQSNFLNKKQNYLSAATAACEAIAVEVTPQGARTIRPSQNLSQSDMLQSMTLTMTLTVTEQKEQSAQQQQEGCKAALKAIGAFVEATKAVSVFKEAGAAALEAEEMELKPAYSSLIALTRYKKQHGGSATGLFQGFEQKYLSLMLLKPNLVASDSAVFRDIHYYFQRLLVLGGSKLPNERVSLLDTICESLPRLPAEHLDNSQGFELNAAVISMAGRFDSIAKISSQRDANQFQKNLKCFLLLFIHTVKKLAALGSTATGLQESYVVFGKLSLVEYLNQVLKTFTLILISFSKRSIADSPYLLNYLYLFFAVELNGRLANKLRAQVLNEKYSKIFKDFLESLYDPLILSTHNIKIRLYLALTQEMQYVLVGKFKERLGGKTVKSESLIRGACEDVRAIMAQFNNMKMKEGSEGIFQMSDQVFAWRIETRLQILLLQSFFASYRQVLVESSTVKLTHAQAIDIVGVVDEFISGETWVRWFNRDSSALRVLSHQVEFLQFRTFAKMILLGKPSSEAVKDELELKELNASRKLRHKNFGSPSGFSLAGMNSFLLNPEQVLTNLDLASESNGQRILL